MPKKIKDFFLDQRGFTLLELIAVMLILGILAALAVPRYIDLEAAATVRAIDADPNSMAGRPSSGAGQNNPDFIDVEIITSLFVTRSKGSRPPPPFSFPKSTQQRCPLARTISCVILVDA